MHPALVDTSHLPFPAPARPWSITMRWQQLLFLHWRVPAESLRPHLPNGLAVDSHDGSAWLGVVPFEMAATRFRLLPRIPGSHTFPELNLRTYVRAGDRAGVWFFSLDAASRLAVEGARWSFGLPYFAAHMQCNRDGDEVHYQHVRRDRRGPAASFAALWRANGPARTSAPGTLEHFLTERYCLFALRRGVLLRGDIAHRPWQLAPAELALEHCDMTRLLDLQLAGAPESALVAQPLDVAAWSPVPA